MCRGALTGDDRAAIVTPSTRPLAATLDVVLDEIVDIQAEARSKVGAARRPWPMIVLRTPKGWTGPREVDGVPVEGTWRAHQVPLSGVRTSPTHLGMLEQWLRSYRPGELFDAEGRRPVPGLLRYRSANGRMGSNPHANGGLLSRELDLPDQSAYAVDLPRPGSGPHEPTRVLGTFLRDVMQANADQHNFRVFGPDETASNRLDALYDVTAKAWTAEVLPTDEHLAVDGRVMEILANTPATV